MGLFRTRRISVIASLAFAASLVAVGVQSAGTASAQTFGTPVAIPGATVGEPGLVVAPGGAIYVDGPSGLGTGSPVFKSSDGGRTWSLTPASLRGTMPGGGDSQLAVDPHTGTLYMVDLWLGSTTTARSTDGAASWTANGFGTPVQDRPWVATAGNGHVYMVTHQIPSGLVVSKSTAPLDGVVYSTSSVAATANDQEGCVCPPGNIVAEGGLTNDKVGVIYSTSTGAVKFASSTNSGLTFTNTVITGDNSAETTLSGFPVVADAGNGHLVAVWMEDFANNDRVQMSTSTNFGSTWSAPQTLVSGTNGTSVYPWVAASGSKVSVSLYHTSTVTTPDNAPAGTQWFETYLESTNGGSTFSPLVTVDSTPVKTGQICTGGTNCSANRDLLDFQTVTLDTAALADVSYTRVLAPGSVQTIFNHEA